MGPLVQTPTIPEKELGEHSYFLDPEGGSQKATLVVVVVVVVVISSLKIHKAFLVHSGGNETLHTRSF